MFQIHAVNVKNTEKTNVSKENSVKTAFICRLQENHDALRHLKN